MTDPRLAAVLRAAIDKGLLPPTATVPADDDRPWPVVLLTALGAWLAALPLTVVFGLLIADGLERGPTVYLAGAIVLGASVAALRRAALPLFVEQLLIPGLLVGAALLGWGAYRDLPPAAASLAMALLALAAGLAVPRPWLRVVFGAAAAALLAAAWVPWRGEGSTASLLRFWAAWHVDLLLWLVAGAAVHRFRADGAGTRLATSVDALRTGWLVATLVGLAWWSGMTFLVGATLAGGPLEGLGSGGSDAAAAAATTWPIHIVSALLAVAAAAWAARAWPALRGIASGGTALVLVALAALMPALGATLLALSVCAVGRRWLAASLAAVVAAWIVGGFYYQLAWPLATKAIAMVGAGAVLGALAWLAARGNAAPGRTATGSAPLDPAPASPAPARLPWTVAGRAVPVDRLGIAVTAVLVVVVANAAIWQKEDLIGNGRPVFVDLAPADPRSLMQGDFMRLDFRMPEAVRTGLDTGLLDKARPHVVARRDARGVATLLRVDRGEPLAADELRIELTPLHGDWVLVSDAWSFAEGEAERWARARYAEFRVDGNGRALLVGLRGANLELL